MDDCVLFLGETAWFSTLDENSGNWQVPIAEEGSDKTTSTCQSDTYRSRLMPFSPRNALTTFQRTLDILLSAFNWRTCPICLDYVVVLSKPFDGPLKDIVMELSTLREAKHSLNLEMCCFLQTVQNTWDTSLSSAH